MSRLRNKLLLAFVGIVLPVFFAFGLFAWSAGRDALEEDLGARLISVAEATAAQLEARNDAARIARMRPDSQAIRERYVEQLEAVRERTGVRRVRVVSPDLDTLIDTEPVAPHSTAFDLRYDEFEIGQTIETGQGHSSVLFYSADGEPYKRGYARLSHDDRTVGVVAVEASAHFLRRLEAFGAALLGFGVVLLILAIVASRFISRRITAPVQRLQRVAQTIGAGDLSHAVESDARDEIGDLARSIERMRQGLLARDEELQMMLAGIAHEVRNPLGGMELFLGVLEEELAADDERRGYVARLRRELEYLKRVVTEFLRFARRHELELDAIDACALAEQIADSVRAQADGASVEVECGPGTTLIGDRDVLRSALQNLMQNGAQAAGAAGSVRVSIRRREDGVEISIRDDGPGIPTDLQSEIFRPFFTTREKGTGLGLPLARKAFEDHGGTLTLTSKPGEGTTITATLPERPPRAEPAPPVSDASANGDPDQQMIG